MPRLNILILLGILLLPYMCAAQTRRLTGKVIDKNMLAIPFAAVEIADSFAGTRCDSNGIFRIVVKRDSVKYFVVHKRGYEESKVQLAAIKGDSVIVQLKEIGTPLTEVTIKSKKTKRISHGILGRKRQTLDGSMYYAYGDEIAMFLEAKHPHPNSYLKEVFVYVTNEGIPTTKFGVHIYDEDSASGDPLHELTDSAIVAHATQGNEWVKIDVSAKHIPVKMGVFITIEWLAGCGNDPRKIHFEDLKKFWFGGSGTSSRLHPGQKYYNGMVIGLTTKYGIESYTYMARTAERDKMEELTKRYETEDYSYANPTDKRKSIRWVYDSSPITNKGAFLFPQHWVNPMIYCTYTYSKN